MDLGGFPKIELQYVGVIGVLILQKLLFEV